MALRIHLGVRTSPGNYKRVTLNDINLSTKIGDLKVEAGKLTNLPMESLELSYCGNLLEDDHSVFECNLQSGVTVHVLKKHVPNDFSKQVEKMTEAQVKQLAGTFTVIFLDPAYSNTLHEMMKQPSQIENLIMVTPALVDDPVAIAILQDPILMERMADQATAKRMAQLHPALAETANYIAKAVEEEAAKPSTTPHPVNYNDNNYPYHMEDFTDDEEMDSSQSSDSVPSHGTRGHITSSQLAAALASATGAFPPFSSSLSGPSQASTSSGQGSSSGSVITSDMLQSALAVASNLHSSSSSSPMMPPPPIPPFPASQSSAAPLAPLSQPQQIQQMHDLGLRDDVVNLHALSITGGDVQAAINLVLSGVITGDDEDQ
ncbi:ubiquitin-like protein 7 isoform X2 [Thrips palmi]|uniref:Ubiquitin-like protein 7 isoform X2 n=1 Tax=Thrips palmi TaxID=161013 RepID=A0A6P8YNL9_THRPL|nr:ubiquitin-like protein 7 isoform X2 [Thrips palmi]